VGPIGVVIRVTTPVDEPVALTVDFPACVRVGQVRGGAVVRVRPPQDAAWTGLRLRRFLPRLTLLRCRDLAVDGSPLEPEREAVVLPQDEPRNFDVEVDLPFGAVAREYRLEWELDPDDHPTIGGEGNELLLFRAYLLGRDQEGAEQIREQRIITVEWVDVDGLVRHWTGTPRTPAPLREALRTLLRAEVKNLPQCARCRMRFELDRLLAEDRVWDCSEGTELEEIRRLLVERKLAGIADQDVILRWHQHHVHEDLDEPLAAARDRHRARLIAYAPG
jgi:hypothetical protein